MAQPQRAAHAGAPVQRIRPRHPCQGGAARPLAGQDGAHGSGGLHHTRPPPSRSPRPLPVPQGVQGRRRHQDRVHQRCRPLPCRGRHPERPHADRRRAAQPEPARRRDPAHELGAGRGGTRTAGRSCHPSSRRRACRACSHPLPPRPPSRWRPGRPPRPGPRPRSDRAWIACAGTCVCRWESARARAWRCWPAPAWRFAAGGGDPPPPGSGHPRPGSRRWRRRAAPTTPP